MTNEERYPKEAIERLIAVLLKYADKKKKGQARAELLQIVVDFGLPTPAILDGIILAATNLRPIPKKKKGK